MFVFPTSYCDEIFLIYFNWLRIYEYDDAYIYVAYNANNSLYPDNYSGKQAVLSILVFDNNLSKERQH